MKNYEVRAVIDGEPVKHDFQLANKEPEPGKVILGLLEAHYEDAGSIYIKDAWEYSIEDCDQCEEGIVKACCKGDPRNIECYCHGQDIPCDCDGGKIRVYKQPALDIDK